MTLDSLTPFVDHPIVAIRSPSVKVAARQVYRISVMVFMINPAVAGAGGLIVRDSIGGERLQFRTPSALKGWFEVVYYRRVPADGTLNVTLGMANYGWAAFDDFKIEPIIEQVDPDQFKMTLRPRPRPKKEKTKTASTNKEKELDADGNPIATPSRPPTANRLQGAPVRE